MTPRPSLRLVAATAKVAELSGPLRQRMWELFARYYTEVVREAFDRDLEAKQRVILLRDSGDRSLQGFSTLQVYEQRVDGRRCVAVFSGDTVIEQAYWGQPTLQRAFYAVLMAQKLRNLTRPVYWFLISKGYRTYLLLSRNVPNHYPRWDAPTPAWEARLLDTLCRDKFGAAWDAEAGVVRFTEAHGRLKPGVAPIESHLLEQPDVRFFVERNPGHQRGDELCCLGRVDATLGLSFLGKHLRRAVAGLGRLGRRRSLAARV